MLLWYESEESQLSALTYTSTHSLRHSSPRDERRRTTTKFLHHQNSICQKTFTFLHAVGSKHYKALKHHYIHHGLVPRIHGNTGKPTANAFHPNEVLHATNFVISYAEANGVVLPGRIPGYKRSDLQLLPSSMTKRRVWLLYRKEAEAASVRAVGHSTFLALWQKFLPQVVITRPLTDLCAVCHRNSSLLVQHSNCSEEEKSRVSTNTQQFFF